MIVDLYVLYITCVVGTFVLDYIFFVQQKIIYM